MPTAESRVADGLSKQARRRWQNSSPVHTCDLTLEAGLIVSIPHAPVRGALALRERAGILQVLLVEIVEDLLVVDAETLRTVVHHEIADI
jgi:hypothetical protein